MNSSYTNWKKHKTEYFVFLLVCNIELVGLLQGLEFYRFLFWNIEKMNVESSGHCCSLLHYRKEQHLKESKDGCLSAAYVLSC